MVLKSDGSDSVLTAAITHAGGCAAIATCAATDRRARTAEDLTNMFADYRVVVGSKGGVSSRELKVWSRCDLKRMAGAIEVDRKERG